MAYGAYITTRQPYTHPLPPPPSTTHSPLLRMGVAAVHCHSGASPLCGRIHQTLAHSPFVRNARNPHGLQRSPSSSSSSSSALLCTGDEKKEEA